MSAGMNDRPNDTSVDKAIAWLGAISFGLGLLLIALGE